MRKRRRAELEQEAVDEAAGGATGTEQAVEGPRADGPWDVSERAVDEEDPGRAFLGSLSVAGHPGVELRLQVDEASEQVVAAMLVAQDGAAELRVFAAPRHESIWSDVRRQIGAEATRRGGTATEVEGPYGPALALLVPAVGPDGQTLTQPSTVLGIDGPRWLLRVSLFGRPAQAYDPQAPLETALRDVVVLRGNQPFPPGEALPLSLPPRAQRLETP